MSCAQESVPIDLEDPSTVQHLGAMVGDVFQRGVSLAGTKTLGPAGKFVVAGFTVLEFFGGSCIMLVVLWQEFVAVLPNHGRPPVNTSAQPESSDCTLARTSLMLENIFRVAFLLLVLNFRR